MNLINMREVANSIGWLQRILCDCVVVLRKNRTLYECGYYCPRAVHVSGTLITGSCRLLYIHYYQHQLTRCNSNN